MARYELEIENLHNNNGLGYSNNNKEMFGLPLMFVYCFIAIIIIIISLIFGIIFLVIKRKNSAKQSADKTVRIIEQSNGQTFVVSANGKQILSTVEKKIEPPAKIIQNHNTLAASGHQNVVLSNVQQLVNTTATTPSQMFHSPRSPNNHRILLPSTALSEVDRQNSRMTHQTYLPHSDESERTHSIASSRTLHTQQTFAGDCSTSSESGGIRSMFEGTTSRSPSHHSQVPIANNPVAVAKVRQDSYYRLQAHNNNIVNAYMHQNQ
jgi:hypothetical protein